MEMQFAQQQQLNFNLHFNLNECDPWIYRINAKKNQAGTVWFFLFNI